MSKLYLCGLCQSGDLEQLKTSLLPLYAHYDGLQYVIHEPIDEELYKFLESIKKDGKIIKTEWCERLDFSRDNYLFRGTMKTNDFFINLDSKEQLYPDFFKMWSSLKDFLINNQIGGVLLYGKRFLYRYHEFLKHSGSPHEIILNAGKLIELTNLEPFKDTSWFWKNVHNDSKRDKYHFVFHFLRYYTFPASNHTIMGNEQKPEIYQIEETVRRQFRYYLEQNNLLPLTKDKFIWLCNYKLNDIKEWLNKSKILNDAARYLWLNRTDFEDDHNYDNKILIN